MGDPLPVVGYSVVVAAVLAFLTGPIALAVDLVAQRRFGRTAPIGSLVITTFLYALGCLSFLENLLYTTTGAGLKTDDSISLKVVFAVAGVALGALVARTAAAGISARVAGRLIVIALVLLVPTGALVVVEVAGERDVAPLEAMRKPHLVNVVILSADGIDADHMSLYGYERETTPFLDAKADEFRVFDNAFTNNGHTTGSITSLLTGMSPLETDVVYPPDMLNSKMALRSLPHLLGGLGYYRSNWAVPYYADGLSQNILDAFDVDNGYSSAGSPLAETPLLGTGKARWFVLDTLKESSDIVLDVADVREMGNPFAQVSRTSGLALGDQTRLDSALAEIQEQSRFFINTHFMITHGPFFPVQTPRYSRGQHPRPGRQTPTTTRSVSSTPMSDSSTSSSRERTSLTGPCSS